MPEQFITNVNEKNLVLTRAQGAVIARDFSTAAILYKQLLRDEPSNVDYLKELGSIYVKNSEDAKAIPYYEQIITFYPHYIEAMNSLGAIFRRLKRYEESIQILHKALDEGRQTAAVNYNLGFTYKEMGNFDDAIEAFEAVIRENPSDVLAYNHMGSIYLAEKNYDKAISSYRKGLQVDPNHPILNYNLARCYTEAKMTNDAIRCYEKTLRVKPGWIEAIKDFSNVLINCQKTKEASDLVQRSIQLHPNDSKLLGMLGKIYLDQYDYDSAEKTFKRARNIDGKDVEILQGLAEALEKEEKPKEALEAVNSALEIEPENKDLIKQYVYTLLSAEDFDAAHDNVQNLYEDNGQEDPQVLDLYGQYYICTNQEENAQQYFDEIEKKNKQYKDHLLSQANRYHQIGDTDQAVEKAKEYVSKVKDNPEGYNTLGKIYQETGNLQGAIDSFNKSKTLVKPNILADKKISHLQEMIKASQVEEKVDETPVEEVLVEEETPVVPVIEEEKAPEEFDFGTMGDNVPMGEALLEKEDEFFDDDPEPEEEPEEEIEEEEEPEPEPVPSFGDYSNPFGNDMKNLEDENLSPFEDEYEEPKSSNEQLVPDADLSGDNKKDKPEDDDLLDSMMKSAAEKPETTDSEMNMPLEDDDAGDFFDSLGDVGSDSEEDKPQTAPQAGNAGAGNSEPDYDYPSKDSPAMDSPVMDSPYSKQDSNPYENQKPYETPKQPAYESPYESPSAMDQFANEMQKRMQDAMMDSAKFAMDSALNAQKMAQQIADEQEKLKNRIDSMPQYEEPVMEPAEIEDPVMDEPAITDIQEPSIDDIFVEPETEETAPEVEISAPEEVMVEAEPEVVAAEPEMVEAEPEVVTVEPEMVESAPEIIDTEPEIVEESSIVPVEAPAAEEDFIEENLVSEFANTDEILSEIAEPEVEIEVNEPVPVEEIPETSVEIPADEVEVPAESAIASMLPGITKILEDDDLAKMNASELELFKKFLTFRDFMPEEEKEAFDSGKIRMLLEYIIAKMSGKPGLLKTVQSLIKSGLLGDDFNLSDADFADEELSNELIKKVLHIMISLSEDLEDKGLSQSLKNCAEAVLEKIALEEGKSQIFN